MSYDVELRKDGEVVEAPRHAEGGTAAIGGVSRAELNITYNYSSYYYTHIHEDEGIRWLDGKKAEATIEVLRQAVGALGTEQSEDYWEENPGNAGHPLSILLDWAQQQPDAEFKVIA